MGIDINESGNSRVAEFPSSGVAAPPLNRRRLLLIISISVIVCVFILIAIALIAGRNASPKESTLTSSYPSSSQSPQKKLSSLPVKGRAPKTNYNRTLFGAPWSDDVTVEGGHNGCDTRNDILRRDLSGAGFQPGNSCIVLSGVLNDPYTGQAVLYQHEPEELSPIQIDHVVPLLDAWQKGAQAWDDLTRKNFANDPINLQATTAAVNQVKGSSDAATWLQVRPATETSMATASLGQGTCQTELAHSAATAHIPSRVIDRVPARDTAVSPNGSTSPVTSP